MRKLLKWLFIVQEVSNEGREPKLGRGFFKAYRLNPYNPLSYPTVIIAFIFGVILFGFVGIWKEVNGNPFKWN